MLKTRKYDFKLRSVQLKQIVDDYYDAAVIVTDHLDVDYQEVLGKSKIIIDTRNALKQKGVKSNKVWKA